VPPSNRVGRQRHAYIKESTNVRTKDLHGEIEGSASRLKPGESIIFFQSTRKQTLGSLSWSRNLEQLWPTFHMFALLHPSSIQQKKERNKKASQLGSRRGKCQWQQSGASGFTWILFSKSSTDNCIKLNSGFNSSSPSLKLSLSLYIYI